MINKHMYHIKLEGLYEIIVASEKLYQVADLIQSACETTYLHRKLIYISIYSDSGPSLSGQCPPS